MCKGLSELCSFDDPLKRYAFGEYSELHAFEYLSALYALMNFAELYSFDDLSLYRGVLKTWRHARILTRFWPDFDHIFGQVFDVGFGQVFWSTKYSVQFYRDREIQFYRVRRKRRAKPSFKKPSFLKS